MPRNKAEEVLSNNQQNEENKNFGGEEKKEKRISPNANRTSKKAHRETLSTHDGHALTPQESIFIDEYLISNGRQAYIKAYPNSNPNIASQNAQRMLNKSYISSEIRYRAEKASSEAIATAEEIMQYFTDVMRGKIKDQFGLEASLGERTKAAQELAKRQIDIPNKLAGNEQPTVTIKLDWSRQSAEVVGSENDDFDDSEQPFTGEDEFID